MVDSRVQRYLLWAAFPVGMALSLAFAPFGIWPVAVLCMVFLFFGWEGAAPRRAAKLGFLFTSGTFFSGTYWLYHTIYVVGHAPLFVAIFLMLGLVAIMGGYTALLGYAQARWLPARGLLRWLVAVPAAWVFLEWFRGWFLSGFPWLSLGYSQIDSPLAGWSPVLGVYGLSLMVCITAGAIVALLRYGGVAHAFSFSRWEHGSLEPAGPLSPRLQDSGNMSTPVQGTARDKGIAVLVGLLPWIVGYALWDRQWTMPVGQPLKVAIVQGAVPQDVKWSEGYRDSTLTLYRHLTNPLLGTPLIIWPEAALPDLSHELQDYTDALRSDAHAAGSDIVMGMLRWDPVRDVYHNGAMALSGPPGDETGGEVGWYYKRRLVPFGEFFPVPAFIRSWLRLMSLPYTDLEPGADDQAALDAAGQKLGMTICYEDSYGAEQLKVLREATVLVNVTNDAWFGDSTAPHQHLEISRMRALEGERPLLRAANDGITAIIDSKGHVVSRFPQFKPGVLTGVVQPRTGLTPYARVGNWAAIGFCTLMLSILAWSTRRLAVPSKRGEVLQ